MKVVQERMELYNFHSNNFSTRVYEYLKIIFQFQVSSLTLNGIFKLSVWRKLSQDN